MTSKKITVFRYISTMLFIITLFLFVIDLFVPNNSFFSGIGLLSTWIFPPVGFLFAGMAFIKTESKKDVLLLILNGIAFFTMFFIMFVGTLLFGP